MKFLDKENQDSHWESIYLDNHLLVVAKAAGVATQPDLHELGKQWLKERFAKPGNVFLEPIHRLDRPVSGLVLFARTSKALSRLNEFMRNRQIQKTYLARVEKQVFPLEATLSHYLVHDDFRARIVDKNHPDAKEAILHYQVLKNEADHALLKIELKTGRYHQIRAQLSEIGHPVMGDQKYGSKVVYPGKKIALHHGKLSFCHPVTQEMLTFHCDWPDSAS
jgi:23S rRNA pseudouridine1911/1915/1917 synthase